MQYLYAQIPVLERGLLSSDDETFLDFVIPLKTAEQGLSSDK